MSYAVPRRLTEQEACPPGEVISYTMTPEELQKYVSALPGPPLVKLPAPPLNLKRKEPNSTTMPGSRRSKYDHITKELVQAELSKGKTLRQIEEEQGMALNTLSARMKAWGLRKPRTLRQEAHISTAPVQQAELSDRRPLDVRIDGITQDVTMELRRAMARFPSFSSAHEGYAVLKEEVEEAWEAIKRNDLQHAHAEMIQVAAMAIRFLHDVKFDPPKEDAL